MCHVKAQALQCIWTHLCFIDENGIVAWSGSSEKTAMRDDIEVLAVRQSDVGVDTHAGFDVA